MDLWHKELPVYSFTNKHSFYVWLAENYSKSSKGFWLRYYKKASQKPTITHNEAVDVAICWGWIDGLLNKYDDESYVVRYTPRRPKSVWSKVNVARVERLMASGEMQPSGLVHVETAKADGRWDAAYAGQSTMKALQAFKNLLATDAKALAFYQSLNKANRYAIDYRLATAVGPEKQALVRQKMFERMQTGKKYHS
jgi:uncharacterized protein YdeI (YjbR/CyaY-like superfamily)